MAAGFGARNAVPICLLLPRLSQKSIGVFWRYRAVASGCPWNDGSAVSKRPLAPFAGPGMLFDDQAGSVWVRAMAGGRVLGRPRGALASIVAALAAVRGCVVATDNERDFEGVRFLNPTKPLPP